MPRRTEPDPQAAKIGARLRELRNERALSLQDLADICDLSKGQISSIENGLSSMTIPTIFRLAKGLGLPPLYLLTFPADDDRDQIAEIIRKLPPHEIVKLRRDLVKSAKESAKLAAKAAKATRIKPYLS